MVRSGFGLRSKLDRAPGVVRLAGARRAAALRTSAGLARAQGSDVDDEGVLDLVTKRLKLMLRAFLASVAMLAPAGAFSKGLAVKDLTTIERAVTEALGPGFIGRAAPARIDLMCASCAGEPIVGVQIGVQNDGTEQRVRAGQTKIDDLERICRARSPECRISALDVAPAVGWVSSYRVGDTAGATAIVIRDGDLLTIRAIARDAASARRIVDTLLPLVKERVVGR
ncbi:hypothetical protein [Glacieibacterium frigidum]|uniref:Uncharacterized protein n=1 Tax=Glacieibacterium frigidum TaxID=2593303 RepID=A0A552UG10_9SPHN|nr:hypothetical protein [Glacieibacterium frigidum]TRW17168.1 hypothetical protein FMM06_02920 [Glacieibacterium frigidum]